MDNRTEQLKNIKDEVLNPAPAYRGGAGLKELPLYQERIKNKVFPVIGEGSHYAKIMFIGEAPGKNEAATGRPFCGASGRILDELLASAGIDRKSVYVTNIVKDRPPSNRDPLPEEINAYAPFLDKQIDIVQPQVITTLGRFSMDYIMRRFGLEAQLQFISQMHGQIFEAATSYGKIKIVPLYHPAVAVYDSNKKPDLIKDFQSLKEFK